MYIVTISFIGENQSIRKTEKTTDPSQVTDKFYHIMLYTMYYVHLEWAGFELKTLVVIGNGCIGSCKSNYHAITTTTTPRISELRWYDNYFQMYFRIVNGKTIVKIFCCPNFYLDNTDCRGMLCSLLTVNFTTLTRKYRQMLSILFMNRHKPTDMHLT
jgi:hypothetical protein